MAGAGDLNFHIRLNATRALAEGWGDTQYAYGLLRALERMGIGGELFFRGEAPPRTPGDTVVLSLIGPHLEDPIPGFVNLLWMISPPGIMLIPRLRRYQAVFIASAPLACELQSAGLPAHTLLQATEPAHFHPDKRPPDAAPIPIAFVGAKGDRAPRQSVRDAAHAGFDVQVWGPGWDGAIPAECWKGKRADYAELAQIYARARIVLNDHMPHMARAGMMSNRSFDALCAGASVVSDPVWQFKAPDIPQLHQSHAGPPLLDLLARLLEAPPESAETRLARHNAIASQFSFDAAARRLVLAARTALERGAVAAQPFRRRAGPAPVVTLHPPEEADPAHSGDAWAGMCKAAREITEIFAARAHDDCPRPPPPPALPPERHGVLHPLMHDLRVAQALILNPEREVGATETECLLRARRVLDAEGLRQPESPYRATVASYLARGAPLFAHAPDGFDREAVKPYIRLWPRNDPVPQTRPIGVFIHLYYHELAPVFARRLGAIDAPVQIYLSTDTPEKAARLKGDFPQAEIRVFPNRGRDIYPKLFGFADVYDRHDIVLHLHGKRSSHSERLDGWLDHCLTCLLPDPAQINRILSFFAAIPDLGMVSPAVPRMVLGSAHWGPNLEIAQELAHRLRMDPDLPRAQHFSFPVGSMFWARTRALRPLLDLKLGPQHFPTEEGQIDATTAHAVERMLGVVRAANGLHHIRVGHAGCQLYPKRSQSFSNNGALRKALEQRAP